MRVDLGNLTEITKKSAAVQNKGTQAVLNENITTKETDKTGHSQRERQREGAKADSS